MEYSSEMKKAGMHPPIPISLMTPEQLKEWQDTIDPDVMGFDGHEGMLEEMDGEDNA